MKISLAGKRAFITAGGAGMGRATVEAMHRLGAEVFTCDIDEDSLASLDDGISRYVCDVSKSQELDRIFDEILPGGIDILVNNAGISGPTKKVEEVTDKEWQQTMAVNVNSQFYCVRRVVPVFKQQQGGVIINLISGAGIMGYPNRTPYVASKWAVTGITKTLAMELGPHNIRVNGIVPGNINGERMDRIVSAHAKEDGISEERVRQLYSLSVSMQNYIDPEEISDLICFLCSDYGKSISGQVVGVDGNTETVYPRTLE